LLLNVLLLISPSPHANLPRFTPVPFLLMKFPESFGIRARTVIDVAVPVHEEPGTEDFIDHVVVGEPEAE